MFCFSIGSASGKQRICFNLICSGLIDLRMHSELQEVKVMYVDMLVCVSTVLNCCLVVILLVL